MQRYFNALISQQQRTGSDGDTDLVAAAESYDRVASSLKSVWEHATKMKKFDDAELRNMSRSIREAGTAEKEGIEAINTYLTTR